MRAEDAGDEGENGKRSDGGDGGEMGREVGCKHVIHDDSLYLLVAIDIIS